MIDMYLVQNILLVFLLLITVPLLLVITYKIMRTGDSEVEKIKKDYEYQLQLRDKRIDELEKYIQLLKRRHEEELQLYSKTSKMAVELKNALLNGAVKLRCPKHPDAEVQVLADGTIVCSEGHRLWPRGENP